MDQGTVDLQTDKLVEVATRKEFALREAIYFVKVESGADDRGWTNKVKTLEEVRGSGAEHYMTSVIDGETVYVVDPGWVAEDEELAAVAAAPAPASTGARPGMKGKNPEADALAQLLLDKLS
ncbi:MAG TPA: hypothetical protein VGK67_37720 [Myxococcales bacterium]